MLTFCAWLAVVCAVLSAQRDDDGDGVSASNNNPPRIIVR